MSQWASMSELERLQHSIRFGTDYQNKVNDPGLWAQAGFINGQKPQTMNFQNGTPVAPEGAPERPAGVSQYVWDRVTNNTTIGLNATSITNNPEVRDALVNAGYGDYVKGAYEKHMDANAGAAISNGADPTDAWDRAQAVGGGYYTQNYGTYNNNTVAGNSNSGQLGFGHEQSNPAGTEETAYQPPYTPADTTGGGGPDTNGGGNTDLNVSNVGGGQEAVVRTGSFNTVDYGTPTGPAVNTGIGVAGANPAPMASTPFADAYVRSSEAARKPGPISGLFKGELGEN